MRAGILCIVLLMVTVTRSAVPSYEINELNYNSKFQADHSVELIRTTADGLSCQVNFDSDLEDLTSNNVSITRLIELPPTGDPIINSITPIGEQLTQLDGTPVSYPTVPVTVSTPAIMRGVRVASITLSPNYYDELTSTLVSCESFTFDVQFSNEVGTNPIQRTSRQISPRFQHFLESTLINPTDRSNPPRRDDDYPFGGSWLYLVPQAEGVQDVLFPLLEWRRQSGSSVQVEVAPADRDGIKEIIQNAYDNWEIPPEYVVLVADADGELRLPAWEDEMPVTDHPYVMLEGDDILPDATIGRLSWNNLDQLRNIVTKIVAYESDPEVDENDWLTHAVDCAATGAASSQILAGRWIYEQMVDAGYDPVDTSFTVTDQQFADWLQERIEEGTSLVLTRSMSGWDDDMVAATENAPYYPLMLMVSANSGRYWREDPADDAYPELWLRSEHGAIASLGSGHNNNRTAYANLFAGSIIQGLLGDRILSFGWALNRAKFELYRQYNNLSDDQDEDGVEWWETHTMMFNLMGDPGTKLWLGTPTTLEVDFNSRLDRGNNRLYVTVLSVPNEDPIVGAVACLYSPEGVFLTGTTNDDGDYIFILPQEAMELESVKLTVTGEGLEPFIEDVVFRDAELSLGVDEIVSIDDGGDNDGVMDNGEEIDITITVGNFGAATPRSPLTVTLDDRSPYYDVVDGSVEIEEDIEPGQSVEVNFAFDIDPTCANGIELLFDVLIEDSDGVHYRSGFTAMSGAPELTINEIMFPEGRLEPGRDIGFDIELLNGGRQSLEPTAVSLVSLSNLVRVDVSESFYDEIPVDQQEILSEVFAKVLFSTIFCCSYLKRRAS